MISWYIYVYELRCRNINYYNATKKHNFMIECTSGLFHRLTAMFCPFVSRAFVPRGTETSTIFLQASLISSPLRVLSINNEHVSMLTLSSCHRTRRYHQSRRDYPTNCLVGWLATYSECIWFGLFDWLIIEPFHIAPTEHINQHDNPSNQLSRYCAACGMYESWNLWTLSAYMALNPHFLFFVAYRYIWLVSFLFSRLISWVGKGFLFYLYLFVCTGYPFE